MKNQLIFLVAGVLMFFAISSWASPVDYSVGNKSDESSCQCYNDDCGCCEYVDLSSVGIKGTVCSNFSYLPNDYGISITLTWNKYTLFNETVSARNPPPICFGIPELEKIRADICLRLFDLTFAEEHFHGCGKVSISIYHIIHKSIDLGCFDIPKESLAQSYTTSSRRVIVFIRDTLEYVEFWKKDSPTVNII